MVYMNINIKCLLTLLIILFIGNIVIAEENRWGGIPTSVNNPPNGTVINEELSTYYNIPTAIGGGKTYWFVGGYGWFNEVEMINLPSISHKYNISPYDCESYGCGSSSIIQVPINYIIIIAFIIASIIIIWKKK